jgi:hypothetical protein
VGGRRRWRVETQGKAAQGRLQCRAAWARKWEGEEREAVGILDF